MSLCYKNVMKEPARRRKTMFSYGFGFFLVFLFLTICVFAYLAQDKMLFFPHPPLSEAKRNAILGAFPGSEIKLITSDQNVLQGWFVQNGPDDSPLLIYYGGNAEDVSMQLQDLPMMQNMHFLFMNYRGYGQSTGKPSQKDFYRDALQIYDEMAQRREVNADKIFLMGRSLGSGVATYVASERPAKGLILVTSFDSILKVAQRHYFFLPISLLLKHPFDNFALAKNLHTPLLAILAENDEVIPVEHGLNLVKAYAGPKSLVLLPGATHNDVQIFPKYWESIRDFINANLNS